VGGRLVSAFRRRHPDVEVKIHEADLGDPTAGLRAGLVDVALTRTPFDDTGLRTHVLSAEPVGVVVHDRDPVAGRASVSLAELDGRRWVRLPEGTDRVWATYWTGAAPMSQLVVAWNRASTSPLIRSFVEIAAAIALEPPLRG
jgi:DNA-binding transcriptional LysR family regulator